VVIVFKSRLPLIAAELEPRLEAIAAAGAELVAARARDRVPVRTGKLRDAIHVEHTEPGEYAVVAGDTDVFYGHIVEHGGAYTPARPFLIPAGEEARPEIVKLAAAALRTL